MPIKPESGEVFGAYGSHELDRDGERGLRTNGVVVARVRQSCERPHHRFGQIDQALDIDRIVKHAQPHAVALSHVSLAGVDLSAERPKLLEVVRRHFRPVLGDVDDQAREIMKLAGLALAVPPPEEGQRKLRRIDGDEVRERPDRRDVAARQHQR